MRVAAAGRLEPWEVAGRWLTGSTLERLPQSPSSTYRPPDADPAPGGRSVTAAATGCDVFLRTRRTGPTVEPSGGAHADRLRPPGYRRLPGVLHRSDRSGASRPPHS